MFKRLFITLSFVLTALCSSAVVAQATPSVAAAAAAASTEDAKAAAVKKLFAERFNNPPIAGVRLTPYGLYEVQLGSDLVYTRRDITRERQDELAKMPFDQLPFELAFKQVRGDGSRKLAIFEDPNCGYCKALRKSLGEIDNLTVYTFPYPILSPDSTQKVKNIWCAKDRAETWDAWMLKGVVPPTVNCEVPVDKMVALGQKLMVRGTPAIFFADGSRVGGAIPKDELEKRLKQ